jgi:hypothetical protein
VSGSSGCYCSCSSCLVSGAAVVHVYMLACITRVHGAGEGMDWGWVCVQWIGSGPVYRGWTVRGGWLLSYNG